MQIENMAGLCGVDIRIGSAQVWFGIRMVTSRSAAHNLDASWKAFKPGLGSLQPANTGTTPVASQSPSQGVTHSVSCQPEFGDPCRLRQILVGQTFSSISTFFHTLNYKGSRMTGPRALPDKGLKSPRNQFRPSSSDHFRPSASLVYS